MEPTIPAKPKKKLLRRKGFWITITLCIWIIALSSTDSTGTTATVQENTNAQQTATVLNSFDTTKTTTTKTASTLPNALKTVETAAPGNTTKTPTAPKPATTTTSHNLSNDNYYVNSTGNTVHSPAYSDDVPVGASAKCRDGTYSFSQSRRGTCSHHGGVAQWL